MSKPDAIENANGTSPGATDDAYTFDEVLRKELISISVRRGETTPTDERSARAEALEQNLVGLSFSGGGIRSATFNLGVLQGFSRFRPSDGKASGFLKVIDYLSTVSGGVQHSTAAITTTRPCFLMRSRRAYPMTRRLSTEQLSPSLELMVTRERFNCAFR